MAADRPIVFRVDDSPREYNRKRRLLLKKVDADYDLLSKVARVLGETDLERAFETLKDNKHLAPPQQWSDFDAFDRAVKRELVDRRDFLLSSPDYIRIPAKSFKEARAEFELAQGFDDADIDLRHRRWLMNKSTETFRRLARNKDWDLEQALMDDLWNVLVRRDPDVVEDTLLERAYGVDKLAMPSLSGGFEKLPASKRKLKDVWHY